MKRWLSAKRMMILCLALLVSLMLAVPAVHAENGEIGQTTETSNTGTADSYPGSGKTGSGEIGNDPATGWFVAFSPIENPKYVVATVIEKGGFGATSAMYAVRDTLGTIYDEPDTVTDTAADTAME